MIEQRKHARFDALNPSEVSIYDADEEDEPVETGKGKTLNISRSGALLETPFPIGNDQKVSLTINLKAESVYISGRVAHTSCEAETCYKTGIEFKTIDERGRQILDKYIELFQKEQNPEIS
ncbi:MAG: PilZ domain-containing protein [Desulfosudaceae bacterium]